MAATKARRVVMSDDLWEKLQEAVEAGPDAEANRSKVIREMVRWYVGEPGAKLPERPADV